MEIAAYVLLGVGLTLVGLLLMKRYLGFTAQTPEDYEGTGPAFDLRAHLNGDIVCEGVIYGPMGRVTSRFTADFDCRWDGNTGVIDETFYYDNGTQQKRGWELTLGKDGRIEARAADVVGTGTGRQNGPSVMMSYDIRLPEESGGHVLKATDWMYLVDNGVIINRSQFRKFGIKVAELVATMRPRPAEEQDQRDAA
ncbi:MAG: DUF3833 domain-containing protein [Pseudomonadota bacterium]